MIDAVALFRKLSPVLVLVLLGTTILGVVLMILWELSLKATALFLMSLLMLMATLAVVREEAPSERLVVEWFACCVVALSLLIIIFVFG